MNAKLISGQIQRRPQFRGLRKLFELLPVVLVATLSACETFSGADADALPTCTELRTVFRASKNDFESIRSGVEVTRGGSLSSYFGTTMNLQGADSCEIKRTVSGEYEYLCQWETGSDSALMGSYYRAIRDQIQSCIKVGNVTQNDFRGSTRVTVDIDGMSVTYSVTAQYRRPPHYVTLAVRRW